jgi:pyrroline-5-carboxylate reductase
MAEAIIRGLLASGVVRAEQVIAGDVLQARREFLAEQFGVAATADNFAVARGARVIVLAVKPQQLPEILAELRGRLAPEQLVVSIAAGVPVRALVDGLGHPAVVRVMPNTPARVGAGMAVWTATAAVDAAGRAAVAAILRSLGREVYVDNEDYLDMATAINGSGPGFVFLFLEALVDAAVHLGLGRPLAEELVYQTVLGSALMAQTTAEHPARLKNLVTSPAGTTAAGLAALEAAGLRAAVDRAVVAAYERSRELGRNA